MVEEQKWLMVGLLMLIVMMMVTIILRRRKNKRLQSPAALILLERWGSPIYGGIAAALYQLIDQLKSSGVKIHCTVLEADGKTIREAERLGVNLILPERNTLFEKEKPTYFWLATHTTFFPYLKNIPNLRFIFGFGIVSSSVAVNLKDKVLPDAEYIHVNVWNPEELTHEMFPYDKEVFDHRCECLYEESERALVVLSMGSKLYCHFKDTNYSSIITHLQYMPLPRKHYLDAPISGGPVNICNFQLVTPFEDGTISELTHYAVVPKAINLVANSYDNVGVEPPKWKILCYNKHDDKEVIPYITQNRKLKIFMKGFDGASLSKELRSTHLVVMPPHLINSLNIVISTIASGKPIIVPTMSDGAFFIEKFFSEYSYNIVVEMRDGPEVLRAKIAYIIGHYQTYLEIAYRMKEKMKSKVMKQIQAMNSMLLYKILPYTKLSYSQESKYCSQTSDMLTRGVTHEARSASSPALQNTSTMTGQSASEKVRKRGTLEVQVNTSYGNAANGTSMSHVEEEFYRQEGNRPPDEGIGGVLGSLDRKLEVDEVGKGCLRYVMKCGSLEALEALWSEYISGRLDKTIHSTTITPTLLSKIQAHYLTLDIYISVQEYLLCKRELPLITGPVTIPSRRHSVAAITELQTVKSEDTNRTQIVDCLHPILPRIPTQETKASAGLLRRDDFRIEEIHHFRNTFAAKRDKLRLDVRVEESKHGQSLRMRDQVRTNRDTERSSISKEEDDMISEFVQLKIDSSQYSSQRKAVLHEAGQKLITQREFAISHATPVKEKFDAKKAVYDEMQSDLQRVNQGYPVKESVLEVFGKGSMPGQFNVAEGIYIKNNGQWVICDGGNHRVQVIDPIKLCCDLILQFHAFPNPFYPEDVTVDEDNDQYFMSDQGNGQVVVSSGQSKILNCFGRKEGIDPTGICLSRDGFILIGDWNGYVRKYNKSGEHIARTEKGQVIHPWGLIVNKKWIFVSDYGRECVHVLNHQMQSIRDIGKGHLVGPVGLCFDHQQDGIYVCDYGGNRVVHFNCDGEFLSYKGQGQLEEPRYIALCKDNPYRLVVTQEYCIKLLYI